MTCFQVADIQASGQTNRPVERFAVDIRISKRRAELQVMPELETKSPARPSAASDPAIMCAADDRYVMPLAVTLSSAARGLAHGRRLRVYLIDTGIGESNWAGLRETTALAPVDIHRIPADVSRVQHLKTSHHISHTAFIRLLAADWLPEELDRVIYLDSDLLVRDDLAKIWELDLGAAVAAAVPDIACPFVDARRGCPNFRRASPYLATISPVRNWRSLGLNPQSPYFNSGVMLIDLASWRRERLADQFLRCLAENERYVWCWDQYALNVVLADRWCILPLRWNVGAHTFEYPTTREIPVGSIDYQEMINDPAIVHFTTEFKPWRPGARHPQRDLYFAALDETAWCGWRPASARFAGMKWWQASGLFVRRRTARAWRKITAFAATPRTKPIPARAFATAEVRSERVAPRDVEFADTARS